MSRSSLLLVKQVLFDHFCFFSFAVHTHSRAKVLPATAIPNVSEGYLSTFSSWMSKMVNTMSIPAVPSSTNTMKWFGGGTTASGAASPNAFGTNPMSSSPRKGGAGSGMDDGAVEMELASEGIQDVRGSKAERRLEPDLT